MIVFYPKFLFLSRNFVFTNKGLKFRCSKNFKKVLDIRGKVDYNHSHLTDTFGGFCKKIQSKSRQVLSIKTKG